MTNTEISNKEALIDEVVSKLRNFSKLYGIKSLFVIGGYCRALAMNRLWEISVIDVVSAYHEQASQLGELFASEELNFEPKYYERTGALAIDYDAEYGSVRIEFQGKSVQSYMNNSNVRDYLSSIGIEDVPLMNNVYGRDFTINTLLYSLINDEIYDPTGKAARDLKNKRLISVLPPDLLIKYNPLAILRAIRFAVSYDLFIESSLRSEMKKNIGLLTETITHERIVNEMVRILKIDAVKALEMFKRFGMSSLLRQEEIENFLEAGEAHEKDSTISS